MIVTLKVQPYDIQSNVGEGYSQRSQPQTHFEAQTLNMKMGFHPNRLLLYGIGISSRIERS